MDFSRAQYHTRGADHIIQHAECHTQHHRPEKVGGLGGKRDPHQRNSRERSEPDDAPRYCSEVISPSITTSPLSRLSLLICSPVPLTTKVASLNLTLMVCSSKPDTSSTPLSVSSLRLSSVRICGFFIVFSGITNPPYYLICR